VVKLSTSVPAPGRADADHTAEFLAAGTTFSIFGPVRAEGVRVERAWIEDEVLYLEGSVHFEGA
jgi:hypothetical protein